MNYAKLLQPPLYVHPAFLAICAYDGTVAIVLSYLYGRCGEAPTPIAHHEMVDAVHLSQQAINRARGLLKSAGYLSDDWERNKGGKYVVYEVLHDAVNAEIHKWLTQEDYAHPSLMKEASK